MDDTLIAEPEKAVCDYLYFVSLGKRVLNERMSLTKLNKDKIKYYSKFFDDTRLNNLINKIF